MKCAIVIADGIKQIMFTPETQSERDALKLITPEDEMTVDVTYGSFFSAIPESAYSYTVKKTQGGYLRAYECKESVMIVLRPKKEKHQSSLEMDECKRTDLEKFIDAYKQCGVDIKYHDRGEKIIIVLSGVSPISTQSNKFYGYEGFYSELEFDKNGKFIKQSFLE